MAEPLLQLLDAVRETAAPSSAGPDPVRDEFLPAIARASSVDDAERVIHGTTGKLQWISNELAKDLTVPRDKLRAHFERAAERLLETQDKLQGAVARLAGAARAQASLLAQETVRRFLLEISKQIAGIPSVVPSDVRAIAKPTADYFTTVAIRLSLLVIAIEHLAGQQRSGAVLAGLSDKAFETSQLLRGLMAEGDIDLTPWLDVPAVRVRRIADSAAAFWESFSPDQQETVSKAWVERTEIPPAKWQ